MIRPCTQSDFDAIYDIINDAAIAYKGVIPADRWHEPYMSREELAHEIAAGVRFFGFEQPLRGSSSETPRSQTVLCPFVGVMGIQDVKDVTLIRHAYVRTAQRNRGIGRQLLSHLRTLATRPLLIGTWAAATWAIRFYEKNGFRLVSPAEKDRLLRTYWTIPDRQIETSVVLVECDV